ncbi:DinB family protein [Roseimaritima ulvae]|uniref:DinB superfamily protein n=1 Tax=Roseimaritima ulvae TaxID=980254 RepID=A0A5B9QNM3_9BACT|nr:hypothetical protein [Roseimaritima ulvae]QEG40574.1 hypothetical protein UC8_25890 [Roseimaritima ulvae]
MRPVIRPTLVCLLGLALHSCVVAPLAANEGDPIAIRVWPKQAVTIETMWDFHVGVRLSEQDQTALPRPVDLNVMLDADQPAHILDREPNSEKIQWQPAETVAEPSPNAVRVAVVPLQTSDTADSDRPSVVTTIAVDGVRIADASQIPVTLLARSLTANSDAADALTSIDVLLLGGSQADEKDLLAIRGRLMPKMVVLPADFEKAAVGDHLVVKVEHNTLALSASDEVGNTGKTRWVKLGHVPWKMPEPLALLFAAKEAASKDSRATFAVLSAAQMSFEPSNGTHTPRWNAEHMMGRELLFFSQIYHAVDNKIPVMDSNPQQMPKDYRAAHPSWTGAEEARQMQRVESFTRRFAYLLEGLDLDKRAPGSRNWTPRSLLEQMQRHYGEHTANVRKKMELPEWPEK